MLLKKTISSFLTLSLILSCFTFAKAQDALTLSDKVEEAHAVLSNIGFVSSDFSKDMVAEMGDVTRGEFAELIHQSFAKGMESDNVYFHDVPKTHYASQAISVLVESGTINVDSDKLFEPERAITRTEAAKIILYSIGYENLINIKGGYPIGVDKVAFELELYEGINQSGALSYGDALVMIYNGLLCEYVQVRTTGPEGILYHGTGETYGERFFGLKVNKGLVTGYNGVSISGESVKNNVLVINGAEIISEQNDLSDFLGHKVKYVTREIDEQDYLLYITKDKNQDYIQLDCINNSFEYKNNSFEYYVSNSGKTANLAQNPTVIYNGAYLGFGITAALSEELYSVKLIETENKGYDLVIATAYESVVLSSIDAEAEKLYVKTGGKDSVYKTIDLNLYGETEISDVSGTELNIEELSIGSILNIFEAKDKSRMKIVISKDSFSGKIESISDAEGRECYNIGGNKFYAYKKDLRMKYEAGQEVTAYLDINGLVADMKSIGNQVAFGFAKNVFRDESDERSFLKIFDETGEFITFATADKVNVDGKSVDSTEVYRELGGVTFAPQLIVYETNSKGEIRHIDTAVANSKNIIKTKNNMLVIEAEGTDEYDSLSNKLGKRMRVNGDTLLFGIPNSPKNADEDLFGVTGAISKLVNQDTYDYTLYSYGMETKEAADVIIIPGMYVGGSSIVSDNFIVTDLRKGLNSDDEVVTIMQGYHGASQKTFNLTEDISEKALAELHEGDIISLRKVVGKDIADYAVNLCPHADTQSEKYENALVHSSGINSAYSFATAQNASFQTWTVRYITGYVSDVVGESVMVKYDRTNAATTPTDFDVSTAEDWDELFIPQGEPIFVIKPDKVNTNKTTEEKGSMADIKTYKATGSDCSRIFIYMNVGDVRNFVIY